MNVVVYTDPSDTTNRLKVIFPGLDDAETAASKFLDPLGIPYVIVDDSTIPVSPFFPGSQTVDITQDPPEFSWEFTSAQQWATNYNTQYWQVQYNQGILGLNFNDYQLSLAVATPENERTAEQIAAIEFMSGTNGLQQSVQDNIDAATTPEELIQILSQLG